MVPIQWCQSTAILASTKEVEGTFDSMVPTVVVAKHCNFSLHEGVEVTFGFVSQGLSTGLKHCNFSVREGVKRLFDS
jgi:hypothetical protein